MNKPPNHLRPVPSARIDDNFKGTGLSVTPTEPPQPEEVQAMIEAAAWELQAVAVSADMCESPHVKELSLLIDTTATLITCLADALDSANDALYSERVDPLHFPSLVVSSSHADLIAIAQDLSSELVRLAFPSQP